MKSKILNSLVLGSFALIPLVNNASPLHSQDAQRLLDERVAKGLVGHWSVVDQPVELTANSAPHLNSGDFSLAAWIRHDEMSDQPGGDIVSQYDPVARRGFHLTLKSSRWVDCEMVGDNSQCYAFVPYQGNLYVATWPSRRVFQFAGIGNWIDRGRLGEELEVMGMVVHNGRFIAGKLPSGKIFSFSQGRQVRLLSRPASRPARIQS